MARPIQEEPQQCIIDKYVNKKFNRLTVISFSHRTKKNRSTKYYFNCLCDCNNTAIVEGGYLARGHTKSCGCARKGVHEKHGLAGTRIYVIWRGILTRCNKTTDRNYKKYGARGITVCNEWLDFIAFNNWSAQNGYQSHLSIERIDNNGNYEPSNCKWATETEQANNRRSSVFIEYNGERLTMAQWSKRLGGRPSLVWSRINIGWDAEKAVTVPALADGYTLKNKVYK